MVIKTQGMGIAICERCIYIVQAQLLPLRSPTTILSMAHPSELGTSKWSSYKLGIYLNRQGPQPLGTVVFEEIEEKAKEKLKDYPGI